VVLARRALDPVSRYPSRVSRDHRRRGAAGPAYRIVTERLCLRCYELRDAQSLKDAIDSSLAHLAPWLAWARDEPQSLDAKLDLLRQFRAKFDLGKDCVYGIFDHGEDEVLGGCGLHARRDQEMLEIGYWVSAAHSGHGLATEATAALTRVAFEIEGMHCVEIHCDRDNVRSARIPQKLGFRHDATLRQRIQRSDGTWGERMIWSLLDEEYGASPASRARIEAFDGIGRRILAMPAEGRRRSAFD
jgi:RimJ/RimL family protein N-acetyltransferase